MNSTGSLATDVHSVCLSTHTLKNAQPAFGECAAPQMAVLVFEKLTVNKFCEQAFSRCAMKAPISLHLQGPPGTGKTRTLLGLLSIVLHAAPKGSIGVSSRPTTRISATRTAEETTRLWKLANPWLSGKAIPRQAETEQLCLLIRVYKLFRQATSY